MSNRVTIAAPNLQQVDPYQKILQNLPHSDRMWVWVNLLPFWSGISH